jgi:hypothetical protein
MSGARGGKTIKAAIVSATVGKRMAEMNDSRIILLHYGDL